MTALGWWISDAWVMTMRNLRRIPRAPDLLFFLTLQPILFILLFANVFGGAIRVPGTGYKQFLMPGSFVQTVAFGSVAATGIGMAEDLQKGIIDRFRSLPMTRSSVLVGRSLSDVVRSAFSLAVMLAVFGFSFSWLAALVGTSVKTVEAAQSGGFIWLFPLTFASSAFVPTTSMPGWLRAFAHHQPVTVTVTVNALRALFNGTEVGGSAWQSAAWSVAVLVVCVPLAVAKYRRVSR